MKVTGVKYDSGQWSVDSSTTQKYRLGYSYHKLPMQYGCEYTLHEIDT